MAEDGVKTEVRRHAERGSSERALIDAVLDEAPFCHVGFVDSGHPYVIPTIHVRVGDSLVLHGSPASRMLRCLKAGAEAAIAVTILDGIVLARSVFNHSMNYRSVVVYGTGREITDPDLKREAMQVFTDKVLPGRWDEARRPSDTEFRGTLMLGFDIDTASAKVRSGPPVDEPEDLDLPVWAGVIPYGLVPRPPEPAPGLDPSIEFPPRLLGLYED